MILVDTSVWIDLFAGRELPHVATLEQLILDNEDSPCAWRIVAQAAMGS